MWIIGDAHGEFKTWDWIVNRMQHGKPDGTHAHYSDEMPASVARQADMVDSGPVGLDCSLQLGDFGIFQERDIADGKLRGREWPDPSKHKFFRGNHDNPNLVKDLPSYLGDYGYLEAQQLFWLAGAWSIDRIYRVPDVSWWHDEELSMEELTTALALYEKVKPRVVITHEAPTVAKELLLDAHGMHNIGHSSHTEKCLQFMFEAHQPELWVFGHFHKRWTAEVMGSTGLTQFECLDEMINGNPKDCILEIPGLTW